MKLTLIILSIILTNCNAHKKSSDLVGIKNDQNSKTGLTLIVKDFYSNIETPETLLITDSKRLQKFYSRINRTRKPGLPLPNIDFSTEMVLVRCSGIIEDGAMPSLYIVEETDTTIVIGIQETDKVSSSSAITTPFSLYKMPLTDKVVVFGE